MRPPVASFQNGGNGSARITSPRGGQSPNLMGPHPQEGLVLLVCCFIGQEDDLFKPSRDSIGTYLFGKARLKGKKQPTPLSTRRLDSSQVPFESTDRTEGTVLCHVRTDKGGQSPDLEGSGPLTRRLILGKKAWNSRNPD